MNKIFTLFLLLSLCSYGKAFAYDVTVAKDGSGNFTTVQAAIDAAPINRTTAYTIYIKNGKYKEVVTIPANKPFLQLIGESVAGVIITYDNYSGKLIPGGGGATYGTNNCATLFVNAADCAVLNITVENSIGQTGDGPQAVAMYVTGDRCVFKTCRFISGQDTIWTNGNGKRSYFRNCYIDGNTDFLFGSMIAAFDSCVIFPRDRVDGSPGGYVTAANTPAGQTYGYVFRDCLVPANRGVTAYTLGRPWQNDAGTAAAARSNSKVVWLNSRMSKSITPAGWSLWDAGTDVSLITYAEYKTRKFDGTLTDVSNRVSWSQQLSDAQAAPYYVNSNLFGTWDPCSATTDICSPTATPLAVSNFRGKKGTSTAVFNWNIDWPVAGATMDLLRSSDNVNFTSVNQQTTPNDTTVNYTYTETVPPAGQSYYYILKISKSGSSGSTASDTVVVSSTPTINVTSALGSFIQGVGTPSSSQSYVVSGTNLTSNVTITAPAGYEISSNNGTTWNAVGNPLVFTPVSGTLANTTIAVRLNAASAGTYNDSLVHTSTGAAMVKLALAGTVQSTPLVISKALLWWPFATSNTDSAAVRSDKVAASAARLNNLYVSQGFNTANIPAYSTTYGQALSGALGTSSANDGSWGTVAGGPGSSLSRNYYEEFTIKANSTVAVRVDSFLLKAAFTSSANGRLAAVYSRTGFTTNDSTNVPGAPFTSPIALAQYNAVTDIRLALNGGTGIMLASGDSLTVRVYLALGSNNVPRFAVLKDVMFKGADSTSTSPGGGGGTPPTTQQPAFPGAEGAGMYTSGGRGTASQPTTVFEVTSLDDTNTPGTLRYAVQASSVTYPYRTIVFRVSGTIHLLSKLNIRGNTTIAGQTAPGDGICLADWPVVISGDNVILRYVRVRMGDKNQLKTSPTSCGLPVAPFTAACAPIDGSGGDDALGNLGNKNIIIDHCSVSWSSDEALTVYRGDSVTLQWNFIEEPLNYSYHFETGDTDFENHGFGGIWGSLHGSFHHNLIANTKSRAPRWAGNNTYALGETERGDFRNNVIYNWELYNVYGGEGGNYNLVNNYYKYGPVTGSATKFRIVNVDSNATFGYAQYYLSGNYVDGSPTNTANNWSGAYMMSGNAADTVKSKHTTPFLSTYPQITLQSATDAYESVLNGAGAVLPRRDTLDQRIVNNVRYRTGRLIDVQGGYPHGTPYAQTLNAWPTLNSTAAPTDTDHDGMPDSWETSNGLNLNDATDRQAVASNGYTNLENYLNGITNISPEVYFSGSPATFTQTGSIPSLPQTVTISGMNLSGNVVLTAPAGYEISIDGGTTWVASGSSITLTPASGSLNGITLSIRLNSGSNGTYANYITAVTAGAAAFYQYVTGSRTSASATASVIWPLLTTPDPTVTGGVTATGQTLGSAISGIQYGSSFGGVNGWQRVASTTNLPLNYNANSYVEYTVTPPAGRTLTVNSFSMATLGGGTGSARMAVYYSTDGFTTSASIGSLTYNGITYANSTDNTNSVSLLNTSTASLTGQQIASASPNIVVGPGKTLSIRVYAWITGTGNRYFTSQNVTLSGSLSDAALPLKLLYFSATEENRSVKLVWNTAEEKNTAGFEVESAADAVHFKTVGTVKAKNEPGNNSYSFTDPQLLDGTRYYRLKMIDLDGSFSQSKTITVNAPPAGGLTIFPNPASEIITATYPVQMGAGKLQVISSDGKVLLTVVLPAGSTRSAVNVKALAGGLYFIKLSGANQVASFIKQ